MDNRDNKRVGHRDFSANTDKHIGSTYKRITRWDRWTKHLLLVSGIPFATLSTKVVEAKADEGKINWSEILIPFNSFEPHTPSFYNPFSEKNISDFKSVVSDISAMINWIKNIKTNIADFSKDLMLWTYEFLTKTVLHTPTFLFDSTWLKSSTLTFAGLSTVMVSLIVVYEGFQRMFDGFTKRNNVTEMKRVLSRIPLITTISAASPFLFYQLFSGLNWLTNFIVDIGKNQMNSGISNLELNHTVAEVVLFIGFDIALIGMLTPVLLQNFRRWFDLLVLAVISPLALSCSIFKEYEHFYHTWLSSIKKKAMTQLTYAIYLVIIGTLMFGTKTPETPLDLFTKLGIMIGGLYSMANPPSFVRSRIDSNGGVAELLQGVKKAVTPHKFLSLAINKRFPKLAGGK